MFFADMHIFSACWVPQHLEFIDVMLLLEEAHMLNEEDEANAGKVIWEPYRAIVKFCQWALRTLRFSPLGEHSYHIHCLGSLFSLSL